jgi:hypothetical protein
LRRRRDLADDVTRIGVISAATADAGHHRKRPAN